MCTEDRGGYNLSMHNTWRTLNGDVVSTQYAPDGITFIGTVIHSRDKSRLGRKVHYRNEHGHVLCAGGEMFGWCTLHHSDAMAPIYLGAADLADFTRDAHNARLAQVRARLAERTLRMVYRDAVTRTVAVIAEKAARLQFANSWNSAGKFDERTHIAVNVHAGNGDTHMQTQAPNLEPMLLADA
jgi:hypothetical protein